MLSEQAPRACPLLSPSVPPLVTSPDARRYELRIPPLQYHQTWSYMSLCLRLLVTLVLCLCPYNSHDYHQPAPAQHIFSFLVSNGLERPDTRDYGNPSAQRACRSGLMLAPGAQPQWRMAPGSSGKKRESARPALRSVSSAPRHLFCTRVYL